jgi:hypothetical protein
MGAEAEYIPITTEDAVEAVLNGAWLYLAEIPDFRALIEGVQQNRAAAGSDSGDLELRCVSCKIIACDCRGLNIPFCANLANLWFDGQLGPVVRARTVFAEPALFSHAAFERDAYFSKTTFLDSAGFDSVTFERNCSFEKATFEDTADFPSATFQRGVDFAGAVFMRDAVFWDAVFEEDVQFLGAEFKQSAAFGRVAFSGDAGFTSVKFASPARFKDVRFAGHADFRGARLERGADFTRAEINARLALDGAVFAPRARLDLSEVDLRPGGHVLIKIDQIGRSGRQKLIEGEDSKDRLKLASAAAQYNMLRDNFRTMPSTDPEEDRCHYKYMDLRRRAANWHWTRRFADWLLFKWCYGYGIYTLRVMLTMVLVILICGGIYWTGGGIWGTDVIKNYDDHFHPLYFSAITFTTIGYGDYAPRDWLRWVAGAEGFLGLFLMAVFTVSFSRKFIR